MCFRSKCRDEDCFPSFSIEIFNRHTYITLHTPHNTTTKLALLTTSHSIYTNTKHSTLFFLHLRLWSDYPLSIYYFSNKFTLINPPNIHKFCEEREQTIVPLGASNPVMAFCIHRNKASVLARAAANQRPGWPCDSAPRNKRQSAPRGVKNSS